MKKELVKTVNAKDELNGEKFCLKYFLVEEETAPKNGFGICSYGIEIVKSSSLKTESHSVLSISYDRREVMKFITYLARGSVTPVSLDEVVYELMYRDDLDCKQKAYV